MQAASSTMGSHQAPSAFAEHHLASQVAHQYRLDMELRSKLQLALCSLANGLCHIQDICVVQVWRGAQPGMDPLHQQLYADPDIYLLGDPSCNAFRLSSCHTMQYGHQGMPGRVLKSGCVQVVQNLRIIPDVLHPRCRITEAMADRVGEVVYVPVYDTQRPHAGPVAVLEALLSARATDSMLVANFISCAGTVLAALQLSLSNPLPQPVRRSKLEGRKPRPVHPDSSPDLNGSSMQASAAAVPGAAAGQAAGGSSCGAAAELAAAAVCGAGGAETCETPQQQRSGSCTPDTPTMSAGSDDRQPTASISCSAASASTAAAASTAASNGGAASVGTAAVAAADSTLFSTLSSRLQDTAAMPPPCHVSSKQQQQGRQRPRWQQDESGCVYADGDEDDFAGSRPCKMQRTLSMSRTKSVPAGLDLVLVLEEAAAAAAAVTKPAQSC